MGYVEIFRIDNEGAGWVDLSEATPDELFNIELGLLEEGAGWVDLSEATPNELLDLEIGLFQEGAI